MDIGKRKKKELKIFFKAQIGKGKEEKQLICQQTIHHLPPSSSISISSPRTDHVMYPRSSHQLPQKNANKKLSNSHLRAPLIPLLRASTPLPPHRHFHLSLPSCPGQTNPMHIVYMIIKIILTFKAQRLYTITADNGAIEQPELVGLFMRTEFAGATINLVAAGTVVLTGYGCWADRESRGGNGSVGC